MADQWLPSASIEMLQARARLLSDIRQFFSEKGVLEVETPVLSQFPVCDPNIDVLQTNLQYFLQTSPEYPMKRLLAAGSGDIYQLAKVFRAREVGKRHNPEFTMLEWYRVQWNHEQLIEEVIQFFRVLLGDIPLQILTYQQAFENSLGLDPHLCTDNELEQLSGSIAGQSLDIDRDGHLALLMSHKVETAFDPDKLTVITDFPASQAALSKIRQRDDKVMVAERFEVFYRGVEVANGYHELTDAEEQRERFIKESARTQYRQYDCNLIEALRYGLPNCAGVAVGVDRLLMLQAGVEEIKHVISFDWTRA